MPRREEGVAVFFFHLGVLNRLIPKRVARPHKTKDKASEAKGPSLVS